MPPYSKTTGFRHRVLPNRYSCVQDTVAHGGYDRTLSCRKRLQPYSLGWNIGSDKNWLLGMGKNLTYTWSKLDVSVSYWYTHSPIGRFAHQTSASNASRPSCRPLAVPPSHWNRSVTAHLANCPSYDIGVIESNFVLNLFIPYYFSKTSLRRSLTLRTSCDQD